MQVSDANKRAHTVNLTDEVKHFLLNHEITVLSSKDRKGEVSGAVVYYALHEGFLYILTKADTTKAHNMMANPQIALTIFDSDTLQTAQINGQAQIEGDLETKHYMFYKLVRPREYEGEELMPPVTELSAGSFIVFKIKPTEINFIDYKGKNRLASR